MTKTRDQIALTIVETLLRFTGRAEGILLGDKPVTVLGLTSMEGFEFAIALEDQLEFSIPREENAFKDSNGRERSVEEIVDFAVRHCQRAGAFSQ